MKEQSPADWKGSGGKSKAPRASARPPAHLSPRFSFIFFGWPQVRSISPSPFLPTLFFSFNMPPPQRIAEGRERLVYAETRMNKHSSRSHAVVQARNRLPCLFDRLSCLFGRSIVLSVLLIDCLVCLVDSSTHPRPTPYPGPTDPLSAAVGRAQAEGRRRQGQADGPADDRGSGGQRARQGE